MNRPSQDIHEIARHRWSFILTALGLESGYLKNRHQPCPLCGGKDRYRFDDKDGKGTYYCNQCGAGNGVTMVMKLLNTDFNGAKQAILSALGYAQGGNPMPSIKAPINAPKPDTEPATDRLPRLMHIWQQTQPLNHFAQAYYTNRGINPNRLPYILISRLQAAVC